MRKEQISKPSHQKKSEQKMTPADIADTFNGDYSAKPQGLSSHKHPPDFDPGENNIDYGEMSLHDAKISGYTDRRGRAVSMATKDVKGNPTGALTDIGAGRSSVIQKSSQKMRKPS